MVRSKRDSQQDAYQLQANLVFYNKIISNSDTKEYLKDFDHKSNETITQIIQPEFSFYVDISQISSMF